MFLQVQWNDVNNGRCGICGDEYSSDRPGEPGPANAYATGTIVGTYTEGDNSKYALGLTF